jgi:hypothetical protein
LVGSGAWIRVMIVEGDNTGCLHALMNDFFYNMVKGVNIDKQEMVWVDWCGVTW